MERKFSGYRSTAVACWVLVAVVSLQVGAAATRVSTLLPRRTATADVSPALAIISRAEEALVAGRRAQARTLLTPLLASRQPARVVAQAHYVLGAVAAADHDLEVARGHFLDAARIFPRTKLAALARQQAVSALVERRAFADAVAEYRQLMQCTWASREVRAGAADLVGEMLHRMGRRGEAVAQWRQLLLEYPGTSWAVTRSKRLHDYVAALEKRGESTGPFICGAGWAPPLAKARASVDGKTWTTETLRVPVGVQVRFEARALDGGELRSHDWDDVNGISVDQWAGSVRCHWDLTGGTRFSSDRVLGVSEAAARTFTVPGRYTVRLRTDDLLLGTAADDAPVDAVNRLIVIVHAR